MLWSTAKGCQCGSLSHSPRSRTATEPAWSSINPPLAQLIWADGGYNAWQVDALVATVPLLHIEIVKRATTGTGSLSCRAAAWSSAPAAGSGATGVSPRISRTSRKRSPPDDRVPQTPRLPPRRGRAPLSVQSVRNSSISRNSRRQRNRVSGRLRMGRYAGRFGAAIVRKIIRVCRALAQSLLPVANARTAAGYRLHQVSITASS